MLTDAQQCVINAAIKDGITGDALAALVDYYVNINKQIADEDNVEMYSTFDADGEMYATFK